MNAVKKIPQLASALGLFVILAATQTTYAATVDQYQQA